MILVFRLTQDTHTHTHTLLIDCDVTDASLIVQSRLLSGCLATEERDLVVKPSRELFISFYGRDHVFFIGLNGRVDSETFIERVNHLFQSETLWAANWPTCYTGSTFLSGLVES